MQENSVKDSQPEKYQFLKRLRQHTQQLHTGLENHPVSASLFKPDVHQTDYVGYLRIMREVVAGFESACYPALGAIVKDIDQRRKTAWLDRDLAALGSSVVSIIQPMQPTGADLPYLLGKMYVLEGSTLGGAVIYRQLQPKLLFTPQYGGRYFYGYGPQTGPMWTLFTDLLSTMAIAHRQEEAILQGANDQFRAMYTHFDKQL